MPTRPVYPRVNCLVPGCRRGTTRAAPHDDGTPAEIICGKHWRLAPMAWRRRLALFRRRYRAAEAKGDELGMQVAARCCWAGWERIKRFLCASDPVPEGEVPPLLAAELQRQGLI